MTADLDDPKNKTYFFKLMFSWYKYLNVDLVFSHLGFGSGNLFLIAPCPDLCLLVPYHVATKSICRLAVKEMHTRYCQYWPEWTSLCSHSNGEMKLLKSM